MIPGKAGGMRSRDLRISREVFPLRAVSFEGRGGLRGAEERAGLGVEALFRQGGVGNGLPSTRCTCTAKGYTDYCRSRTTW